LRQQIAVCQRLTKRPPATPERSSVLAGILSPLEPLPRCPPDRAAQNGRGLASQGLPPLLALDQPVFESPPGRPPVPATARSLIRRMNQANPFWGAPLIDGEMLKPWLDIGERTVSRLLPQPVNPPFQTWQTFPENHARDIVSLDFFTEPTLGSRVRFILIVLSHELRRIVSST